MNTQQPTTNTSASLSASNQQLIINNKQPITNYIEAVHLADSSKTLIQAVATLASLCHEQTIPTLIEVLGYNNPGVAMTAVEGLINIGIPAVPSLLEQLDGYNYGARAWAIRTLAEIGDPRALDKLRQAAQEDFAFSVRRAAARGLGTILWSELSLELREPEQTRVFETLIVVSQDGEWVVRYATIVGLQGLATQQPILTPKIRNHLQTWQETEAELAIRARIQLALQSLN